MRLVEASSNGNLSGGTYSMVLENGDLRLYSKFGDGGDDLCYWSLNQSFYGGNLSKVAYAGNPLNVHISDYWLTVRLCQP